MTKVITSVKLQIDLDCMPYISEYKDPQTEFFNLLDSIKGLSYSELPYDDNNKKAEEDLIELGQTVILTPEVWHEATGTPYDKTKDIIVVFKKYLDRVVLSNHLILIDYYIFSDKNEKNKYSDFITQIFSEHLKKLQKITFITSKDKYKKKTEQAIVESFLNIKRHLKIETKFSDKFHDRFWLCGKKGMFVGTSLTGIGKKYCLIDYINHDDILDINKYLLDEGLI